jgi:hypothetical protein
MGITPISNLPPLQLARSIESDLELMPMSRVEDSARTGDLFTKRAASRSQSRRQPGRSIRGRDRKHNRG